MGGVSRRIVGISEEEVPSARRGFRGGDAEVRAHIEKIGLSFLRGYHAALAEDFPETLTERLEATAAEYRRIRSDFCQDDPGVRA